ncbi:Mucin 3A, cell surface-associated [Apodemus speciosus]|uniref:Mucin 3A, cell surface-associated n=1 Tax=Apodemus speciosus TaxID=105296 RepID=A0ABQ0ETT4_APOSI
MLLLWLLWLLRASPGEAGTPSVTTATSSSPSPGADAASTAPRGTPHAGGAPQWLLSPHQSPNPAPGSGEHTPRTAGLPGNFKPTYESSPSSPVSPDSMTALMSKFVIKVETSPPTVLVYTPTAECIQPSGFTIATTHLTTTCVTRTYVPFTSSYATTPMTGRPTTTITALTPLTSVGEVTSSVTSASTVTNVDGTPTIMSPPSSVTTTYTAQGTLTSSTTGTVEMITVTPTDVRTTVPLTPGVTYLSATAPSQIPTKTSFTTVTDNTAPPSTSFLITEGIITKPFPTASNSLKTETSSIHSLGPTNKSTSMAPVAKETTSHSGEPSVGVTLMSSGRTTRKPISDTPREAVNTASSHTTTPATSSASMVTISASNMATSVTTSSVMPPPSTFLLSASSDTDSTFRTPTPGTISIPSPSGLEGTSQPTDTPSSHGPGITTTVSAATSHLPADTPGFMATMTSLGSAPYVTLTSETLSPSKDIQTLTTSLTTLSMGDTVPWGTMTDFTSTHEAPSMPATHTNFISSYSTTKATDTVLNTSHPSPSSVLPTLLSTGSAGDTSIPNTSAPPTSAFSASILPDSSGTTQMDSVPSAPTITHAVHMTAEPAPAPTTLTAPTSPEPSPTSAVTGTGQPPFPSHSSTLNPTTDLPTESPPTEIPSVTPPTSFSVTPTAVWLSEPSSTSSPPSPNVMTSSTSRIRSSTPAPDTQSVTTGMTATTPLSVTVLPPTQATSTAVSHVNPPGFPNNTSDITSPTTTTHTLIPDPSVRPSWTSRTTSEASRTAITSSVTTATLVASHSSPGLTTSDSRSTDRTSTAASTSHPSSAVTRETLTSVPTSSPRAGLSTIAATHLPSSSTGDSGSSAVTPTSTHAHPGMSATHTSITLSSLLVHSTEVTRPVGTAHSTTPSAAAAFTTTGNTQPPSLPVSVAVLTFSMSTADASFGNTQTGSTALSKPLHTTTESTPTPTSTASTEPLLTTATPLPATDLPPESLLTEITATSQITSPVAPSDPAVSTKVMTSPPAALSSVSVSSTQPVTTDHTYTAPLSTLKSAFPTSRASSTGTPQATNFSSLTNAVTVLTLEMSSPSSFTDTMAPDTSLMATWPSLPTSGAVRTSTTHLVTTATQTSSLVTSSATTSNIYSTDRISTPPSTSVRDTVTTLALAPPTTAVSTIPTTALNTVPLATTDIPPTHEGSITSTSHTTLPPFLSSPQNLETTLFITSARTTPSRTDTPSGTGNHSSPFVTSLPVTSASSLSLSAGRTGTSQTGSGPSAPTLPHSLDTTVDSTATPVTTHTFTTAASTEPPSPTTSVTRTSFTTIMTPTRKATVTSTTGTSARSPVSEVTTSTPSSSSFVSLVTLSSGILTTSTSPTAHMLFSHTSRVPNSHPVTAESTHTLPLTTLGTALTTPKATSLTASLVSFPGSPTRSVPELELHFTSSTYTTDATDASSTAGPPQLTSATGDTATTHRATLTPSLRPSTLTDLERFLTDSTSAVSSFPSTHLHTTTASSLTPTPISAEPLVTTTGGAHTLPVSSTPPAHSAPSLPPSILPSTEARLVSTQHTTPTSTTDNPSRTGNPTSPHATGTPGTSVFSSISASGAGVTRTGSWPSAPITNHTLRTMVELATTLRATMESSPPITSQQPSPSPAVTSTGKTTRKLTTDHLTESLNGTRMDTSSVTPTETLASGTHGPPSLVTSSVLTSTTKGVLPSVSGSSPKPVTADTTHSTPLSASETTPPVTRATSAATSPVSFPSSVTHSPSHITSPTSILATRTPDTSATPTWSSLLTSEPSHAVTTQMVTMATLPPSLSTPRLTSLNSHPTVSLSSTAISAPPATSGAAGNLTPTIPSSPSSGLLTMTDTALTSSSMGSAEPLTTESHTETLTVPSLSPTDLIPSDSRQRGHRPSPCLHAPRHQQCDSCCLQSWELFTSPCCEFLSSICLLLIGLCQDCYDHTEGQCPLSSNPHTYTVLHSGVHPDTRNPHHTHSPHIRRASSSCLSGNWNRSVPCPQPSCHSHWEKLSESCHRPSYRVTHDRHGCDFPGHHPHGLTHIWQIYKPLPHHLQHGEVIHDASSAPLSAVVTSPPSTNAASTATPQVTFLSSVTHPLPTSPLLPPSQSQGPQTPLTHPPGPPCSLQNQATLATPLSACPQLPSLHPLPPQGPRGTSHPQFPSSPHSGLPTMTDMALTSSFMGSTTMSLMTDTAVTPPITSSVTVTGPLTYGRSTSPSHGSSNVLTSGTSLARSSMSVSSSQHDATVSVSSSPLSVMETSLPSTNATSAETPQVTFLGSTTYSMADSTSASVTDTSTLPTFLTPTQPSPRTSGTTMTVTPDLYTTVTLTPSTSLSPSSSPTQSPDSTTAPTTPSHPAHPETLTSLTSSLPSEGIPASFGTGFSSSTGNSGTSAMMATTSTDTSSRTLPTRIVPPSSITQNTGISHLSTTHSIAPIVTTTVTVTRDTPPGSLGTSMSVSPGIPLSKSTSTASVPTGASPTSPNHAFSSFYTQGPSPNFSPTLSASHAPSTTTAPSTLKTLASTPTSLTTLTSLGEHRTDSLPRGSTSTNAVVTAFATLIFSTPTVITSASPSLPTRRPMLTTTTEPTSPSSLNSSIAATFSSVVTSFPPPSTTRTSPTSSPLTTAHTESTPFSYISLPSTTLCPETITITIVPSSPSTPCVDINPGTGAASAPITPFSVLPSVTNMVTSSGSTSERTFFSTRLDTPSMTPETEPSDTITDAPSSTDTRTVVTDTVFRSTSVSTRDNRLNATSITTPNMPGSINVPSTLKPSNTFPTTTTSSKAIDPVLLTTRTPETSVATVTSPTTLTSPQSRPTSASTQMTTAASVTTSPGVYIAVFHDTDTVETEVGMEVSVEQEFSPDLEDNTSKGYRDFCSAFQGEMRKIYQTVQGFQGVEILSLRRQHSLKNSCIGVAEVRGSVVVDYRVLLRLPFSPQLRRDFEKVKTALKEELQSASRDGGRCQDNQTLCFKSDSIKVNNRTEKELTPEAICRRAAPEGYEEHYFPLVEPSRLRCVTNCTPGVSGTLDCNQGQCFLHKSGPTCRCFSTDTHWVSGPRCEVAVDWRVLVGGLVGAATVLLLCLVALSVWVARSRGRDKDRQPSGRSRTQDGKWFEIWDEDSAGTFSNRGFQEALTATNENFHVALEKVDTNVTVPGLGAGSHPKTRGDLITIITTITIAATIIITITIAITIAATIIITITLAIILNPCRVSSVPLHPARGCRNEATVQEPVPVP